jgi:hypothetical protein
VHVIEASRVGYKTSVVQLTRDDPKRLIEITLKPQTRDIHLAVEPVPAVIKINDRSVTDGPVSVHTEKALPFTVDERNHWTNYTVTAEREGFRPAQVNVTWTDNTASYTLRLEPMRKELNVKSTPSSRFPTTRRRTSSTRARCASSAPATTPPSWSSVGTRARPTTT